MEGSASPMAGGVRIGVVGAGGAGGYFAARWCGAGHDVMVLARGRHAEAMADAGLRVLSPLGDATAHPRVVTEPDAFADAQVVVFATKTWQLPAALEQVGPHVSPGAAVFGLQNGVDAADRLAAALPGARVLGGTCRIISFIESPGVIRHVGADPTIVIGPLAGGEDSRVDSRVDALADALTVAGSTTVLASRDVAGAIWAKFLFFAPVSGIGAMSGRTIGEVRGDEDLRAALVAAMDEVGAVASALGVDLAPDAVERTLDFVDRLPADGTSSLQRDVAAGRPTELDALSGRVVELGAGLGVPTPTHARVVDRLTRS